MLRCSACNTLNPSDHTFCGYCGSRLSALSGNDQPLPAWLGGDNAAPTPEDAQPADTALPPWLATPADRTNITQPINTTQADENAADQHAGALPIQGTTQANSADSASTLPPWLTNSTASTTVNDVPDWLHTGANASSRAMSPTPSSTATPTHAPQPTTVTDGALPDWLFDMDTASAHVPTLPEQAPPAAQMSRDLVSNTTTSSTDTATPPASEESLDWLLNPQQAAVRATAAPPSADTLPDWLRDDVFASSSETQSSPSIDQSDLPSWLRDETPTPTQHSTTNMRDALGDQFPHDAAAPAKASDSLPAWLRDDVLAPPSAQGRTTTPLPVDDSALGTNNDAAQRNHEEEQEALPAWLRDDPGTVFPDTPAAIAQASVPSSADQGDVPAWLRDDANTATIETVPPTASMTLPIAESEPAVAADAAPDTIATESASPPATRARVYDVADDVASEPAAVVAGNTPQPEGALAGSVAPVPESAPVVQPAVYDAPPPQGAPPTTEDAILAAITQPSAVAIPATPVATPSTPVAIPATPPSAQAPERPPAMAPPRRQRGNGLWIMLIIVLLVALAAVGWLALRFNGIL